MLEVISEFRAEVADVAEVEERHLTDRLRAISFRPTNPSAVGVTLFVSAWEVVVQIASGRFELDLDENDRLLVAKLLNAAAAGGVEERTNLLGTTCHVRLADGTQKSTRLFNWTIRGGLTRSTPPGGLLAPKCSPGRVFGMSPGSCRPGSAVWLGLGRISPRTGDEIRYEDHGAVCVVAEEVRQAPEPPSCRAADEPRIRFPDRVRHGRKRMPRPEDSGLIRLAPTQIRVRAAEAKDDTVRSVVDDLDVEGSFSRVTYRQRQRDSRGSGSKQANPDGMFHWKECSPTLLGVPGLTRARVLGNVP
jgi:hypothetical protein